MRSHRSAYASPTERICAHIRVHLRPFSGRICARTLEGSGHLVCRTFLAQHSGWKSKTGKPTTCADVELRHLLRALAGEAHDAHGVRSSVPCRLSRHMVPESVKLPVVPQPVEHTSSRGRGEGRQSNRGASRRDTAAACVFSSRCHRTRAPGAARTRRAASGPAEPHGLVPQRSIHAKRKAVRIAARRHVGRDAQAAQRE